MSIRKRNTPKKLHIKWIDPTGTAIMGYVVYSGDSINIYEEGTNNVLVEITYDNGILTIKQKCLMIHLNQDMITKF
jgi:hypothetical protein